MWINLSSESLTHVLAVLGDAADEVSRRTCADIRRRFEEERSADFAYYREEARGLQTDGEVEVDDDAVVSLGAEDGAYVMGWVWVDDGRVKESDQ